MSHIYCKPIYVATDLEALDRAAAADGKKAVGVGAAGGLYKWDRDNRKPVTINVSEAATILDIPELLVHKAVTTRGKFDIQSEFDAMTTSTAAPVVEEEVKKAEEVEAKPATPAEAVPTPVEATASYTPVQSPDPTPAPLPTSIDRPEVLAQLIAEVKKATGLLEQIKAATDLHGTSDSVVETELIKANVSLDGLVKLEVLLESVDKSMDILKDAAVAIKGLLESMILK
jgi:hypothetical protein